MFEQFEKTGVVVEIGDGITCDPELAQPFIGKVVLLEMMTGNKSHYVQLEAFSHEKCTVEWLQPDADICAVSELHPLDVYKIHELKSVLSS